MRKPITIVVIFLCALVITAIFLLLLSQATPTRTLPGHLRWETRFDSGSDERDQPIGIRADSENNLVIVSRSFNGSDDDIVIQKIGGEDGQELWRFTYSNTSRHIRSNHDSPVSFVLDARGSVYVHGLTCVGYEHGPLPPENSGSDFDALLFKLDGASGELVWEKRFDAGRRHMEEGGALVLGRNHQLYLSFAGYDSFAADYRYHVVRLDAETGDIRWWSRETLGLAGRGRPFQLALDSKDDAIVVGTATSRGEYPRLYVAKLSSADGALIWEYVDQEKGNFNGSPRALAIGRRDSACILHSGPGGPLITCLEAERGTIGWQAKLDSGAEGGDFGDALIAGPRGDIIATGRSLFGRSSPSQIVNWTAKFAVENGEEEWRTSIGIASREHGSMPIFFGQIAPTEILIDSQNDLVICGTAWNGANLDFFATWIDSTNGNRSHTWTYDGSASDHDWFAGAVFLPMDKLVLTGASSNCRSWLKPFKQAGYRLRSDMNWWNHHHEAASFDERDPYNYDTLTVKLR
jgi:outer membrane protein assembly factor BamB